MARDVALTLAGGGNRALIQTGILRRWWPRLEPRIAVLSACSAGASMAVSLLTGRELEASAYWFGRRAGVLAQRGQCPDGSRRVDQQDRRGPPEERG